MKLDFKSFKAVFQSVVVLLLTVFYSNIHAAQWTYNGTVYNLSIQTLSSYQNFLDAKNAGKFPWYGDSVAARSAATASGQTVFATIVPWTFAPIDGVQDGSGQAWQYLSSWTSVGFNTGTPQQVTHRVVIATPAGPPVPTILDITNQTNSGLTSDTLTKFNEPTVVGTAQANTTVRIFVGGSFVGSIISNGAGDWSFTLPAQLVDGTINVRASAQDSNGESAQTTNFPITIDTLAPTIGPITLNNASNSGSTADLITKQSRPILNGTAEAGATVTIYQEDNVVGTTTADGSGNWSYTLTSALTDEVHNFTADATDAAGNTSTRTQSLAITIDTQVVAPTGVLNTNNITNNNIPVLNGTDAEPYAVIEIFLDGSSIGTTAADDTGQWSYPFSPPIVDGVHGITLRQTDIASNRSSESSTVPITVDTIAPNSPVISGILSPTGVIDSDMTSESRPTIVGTAELNSSVNIFQSGVYIGQATTDPSGNWSFTFTDELTDGTTDITATATDVAGNSSGSSSSYILKVDTVLPNVQITGPTDVQTGPFSVTVTFDEAMWGFDANDITIANGTVTRVEGGPSVFTAYIDPVMGQYITISINGGVATDAARNPNTASNEYSVLAGSPASEFEKYSAEIRQILVSEAERELRTTLSVNKRVTQSARDRMIKADQAFEACIDGLDDPKRMEECQKKHRSVAFNVSGTASVDNMRGQTQGQFFGLQANEQNQSRDIVVGDFSVLREKAGSQTATLSARWVREHDVSERNMLSYFVGADLSDSDIKSTTFKGDNERVGLSLGVSGLYRIAQGLYLDGFVSYGQGRNDLAMANEVLALTSQYTTRTTAVGGALTGVLDYKWGQLRPELSWSHGRNKIGEVRFTGRAYGLTDDNLRLDAGAVTVSELLLRPEVRMPMGAKNTGTLRFAPRLLCEKVKATVVTNQCGSGGEVGLEILSVNDLTKMNLDLIYDRLDNTTRRSLKLVVDHRF